MCPQRAETPHRHQALLPKAADFLHHPTFCGIGAGQVTPGVFHHRHEPLNALLQVGVTVEGVDQRVVGAIKRWHGRGLGQVK